MEHIGRIGVKERARPLQGVVLLLVLVLGWMLLASQALALPMGPTISWISNETPPGLTSGTAETLPGGYIGILDVTAIQQNDHWKAFAGNVTGSFALADSSNRPLYEWTVASFSGEVHAVRNQTGIDWAGLECANESHITTEEGLLDHNATNTQYDGINVTFWEANNHPAFTVGTVNFGADECNWSILTYSNGTTQTGIFDEILLHAGSDMVYTTIMETNAYSYANDSSTFDFQMIVPENATDTLTSGSVHTYYLYIELL